jgi:hypothetical protein
MRKARCSKKLLANEETRLALGRRPDWHANHRGNRKGQRRKAKAQKLLAARRLLEQIKNANGYEN